MMRFRRPCVAHIYHVAHYVSSIGYLQSQRSRVTLRRVQRGVNIGDVLRAQLKARGWTQKQLGEKAKIGREDINAICGGKRVGEARLIRIARALGMEPEALHAAAAPEDDELVPVVDLDRLLAQVEEEDGAVAVVARGLRLLTRRLELAERQLVREGQLARGGRA